jgi:hypothetical protein
MKNKSVLFSFTICLLFCFACSPHIYKAQNFGNALQKHKTVAIIPAEVTMKLRPNQSKNTTREQLLEMEKATGYDIQDKMQGWFLRRSSSTIIPSPSRT